MPSDTKNYSLKETMLPVRDGQATIHSSFQSTEDLVPSSSSSKTCIQIARKGTRLSIHTFHVIFISGHFNLAFVGLIKAKFVQKLQQKHSA